MTITDRQEFDIRLRQHLKRNGLPYEGCLICIMSQMTTQTLAEWYPTDSLCDDHAADVTAYYIEKEERFA